MPILTPEQEAREKIDRARVTGKDGVYGKLLNQIKGRVSGAQRALESIEVEQRHKTGFWLPGSRAKGLALPDFTGRAVPGGGSHTSPPRAHHASHGPHCPDRTQWIRQEHASWPHRRRG